jgi:hypothetical protein
VTGLKIIVQETPIRKFFKEGVGSKGGEKKPAALSRGLQERRKG